MEFLKARVVAVTQPTMDFIPDAEGLISYCARVSSPSNQDNFETASKLLSYCARNHHWSVFDMANIVVEIDAPRDIARQVLRHSSIKPQEFSQRYAEAQEFVIREARLQDEKNRQNSLETDDEDLKKWWENAQQEVLTDVKILYKEALRRGIAKECARVILPEGNTMSYMYANGTVRSWITYLKVRDDFGVTQKEHVILARRIREAILEHFPFLKDLEY